MVHPGESGDLHPPQAEVAELLESPARARFDLDRYRILARHLATGRTKVIELGAQPH